MEVEYFPSQRRAGYGGAEARVPSAHKHRSFTTVPPTATSFRSTSCLECDLYMEDTRQSHAHRVFDGRSRVSLGQSSGGMAHGSSNSGLETEQGPCLQRKCTDPGDQPTTWRPGYQVSDEMPLSSFGHEHVQGRHCKVPAAPQDLYNSYRSTSHAGIQSELLSRASDSDTHQAFVIMPHIHRRVLSVKIHMMAYPVTSDVLYQVFSAYGEVEMIIPMTSLMEDRLLIQYQHEQMAGKAHKLLHGRCIYQLCCQLEIRYAHKAELEILHPFQCIGQPTLDIATVPCTRIVAEKIKPQVLEQSSSTSLDHGINVESNQQVTLEEIKSFLDEWRAEREHEERSRVEQAELKSELEYFLHQAFDIFDEESESVVVSEIEMKNKRKQEEQLRIEQELQSELDYFLYQAFDLFGEDLECAGKRK